MQHRGGDNGGGWGITRQDISDKKFVHAWKKHHKKHLECRDHMIKCGA